METPLARGISHNTKGENTTLNIKDTKLIINKPTQFEAIYLKVNASVRYWEDAKVNRFIQGWNKEFVRKLAKQEEE